MTLCKKMVRHTSRKSSVIHRKHMTWSKFNGTSVKSARIVEMMPCTPPPDWHLLAIVYCHDLGLLLKLRDGRDTPKAREPHPSSKLKRQRQENKKRMLLGKHLLCHVDRRTDTIYWYFYCHTVVCPSFRQKYRRPPPAVSIPTIATFCTLSLGKLKKVSVLVKANRDNTQARQLWPKGLNCKSRFPSKS